MRSRKEIEESAIKAVVKEKDYHLVAEFRDEVGLLNLCLEVLLDIRDAVSAQDTRPAVTHPKSPPPPEVSR